MNKTAVKNYAIWARVQLIEAAKQRAYEYEITENGENKAGLDMVGGKLLTKTEKEQRNQLISEINRKGYSQVMEEAAYTWFNRFIALRFMEVNGYLPSKVRVFTDENGAFKPEILKQAMTVELEGLDRNIVLDLLDRQDNEELYKYLLITQCNALNAGLPYMFEKISNWTELLFPANLLRQDSVIGQMITEISEDDWTDAVQIIGWLYQYYNSELKDETFALLKKNVKITKERIPAATQLFTPDWIVRYMVENSLGRLWYEGHSDFDKSQWKYYLDEAEQEPEVEEQLKKIRAEYAQIRPEDIKVIDPCMGSGHILVYAFDVLMQIYTSAGWSERDAAKSILANNLYGLDIDDRAGQLAYFAVMMKARKHSRRILNGEVKPNVLSIQDSNWMTDEFISYVAGKDSNMKADLVMLRKTYKDAKEYGSILNVPAMQYDALYERIDIISRSYAEDLFQSQYRVMAVEQLLPLVKQSQIMSQKYHVVVTNPPYMGSSAMNSSLLAYIRKYYSQGKSDLYAVFVSRCGDYCLSNGFISMITMHNWMFLSSYENLRRELLTGNLINMAHLGARAFDEIAGEVVQTTAFTRRKGVVAEYVAAYSRLLDGASEKEKEELYLSHNNINYAKEEQFEKLPGYAIAYWINSSLLNAFAEGVSLEKYGTPRTGIMTGDNNRFLRLWWEPTVTRICFTATDENEAVSSGCKWFPYNKGGSFRRWYGNNDYIVNWANAGYELFKLSDSDGRNSQDYPSEYKFKPAISWSQISTDKPAFRAKYSCLSDITGACFYAPQSRILPILAFCNSSIVTELLNALNPTTHFQAGNVGSLPILFNFDHSDNIKELTQNCIDACKQDWDVFETSWDFKKHPLI